MRCLLVTPLSGVVIASNNSAREVRSTTGVPVMPEGVNVTAQEAGQWHG